MSMSEKEVRRTFTAAIADLERGIRTLRHMEDVLKQCAGATDIAAGLIVEDECWICGRTCLASPSIREERGWRHLRCPEPKFTHKPHREQADG
jgi:hypothetical protein